MIDHVRDAISCNVPFITLLSTQQPLQQVRASEVVRQQVITGGRRESTFSVPYSHTHLRFSMTSIRGYTKLSSSNLPPSVQWTSITPYLSKISWLDVLPKGTFVVSMNMLVQSVSLREQHGVFWELTPAVDHGKYMNPSVSYSRRTSMSTIPNELQNNGAGLTMQRYRRVRCG